MDGWNTSFLLGWLFSGAMLVSGRVFPLISLRSSFPMGEYPLPAVTFESMIESFSRLVGYNCRSLEGPKTNMEFPKWQPRR